jgi:hypothetical protein
MEDKRDGDGLRDGHHPPPHDARSSFESAQRMRTQGELARLREEQGRLRERQDALDRALQARKPDGAAKPEAKDQDGANQDEDGEPSGEGKEKTSAEPPTKGTRSRDRRVIA